MVLHSEVRHVIRALLGGHLNVGCRKLPVPDAIAKRARYGGLPPGGAVVVGIIHTKSASVMGSDLKQSKF